VRILTIFDYLKKEREFNLVDAAYYRQIDVWKSWYRGKVRAFHNYSIVNGGTRLRRTRASLNMAKQGCEYWANLLWNGDCSITFDGEQSGTFTNEILERNNFKTNVNRLTEQAFALGTGAFVIYADSDDGREAAIDYIPADCIFPLAWVGDEITDCAFAGSGVLDGKSIIYLMIHTQEPDGSYLIENVYFEVNKGGGLSKIQTPDNVKSEYTAITKRFYVFSPNIVNNVYDGVPLGVSVYANSIDVLKSIDLAYDGAKTAMELGRPRIGVSTNMTKFEADSGQFVQRFDPNDIAVYDLGDTQAQKDGKPFVEDMSTPYRAGEFEQSLQTQLNIYSQSIGLGDKAFKWETASVATATQIVSENSSMLRAMEKHQMSLADAIKGVCAAVQEIGGVAFSEAIPLFDDSITRNKEAESLEAWSWVLAGKYPFWRYLVNYKGYDEAEAREIEAEAALNVPDDPFAEA